MVKTAMSISKFSVAKATLHSHMCVCSSVSQLVTKTPQQLEIIILHHSCFNLHHSSFILNHSTFISRRLSFSACYTSLQLTNLESNVNKNVLGNTYVDRWSLYLYLKVEISWFRPIISYVDLCPAVKST